MLLSEIMKGFLLVELESSTMSKCIVLLSLYFNKQMDFLLLLLVQLRFCFHYSTF